MNPDKERLLALILRPEVPARESARGRRGAGKGVAGADEPPPTDSAGTLNKRTAARAEFQAWLRELERHLPPATDPELDEYFRYALMGVVVGFGDRNLSPYLPQHTAILAPLLEDIRAVYQRIRADGAAYSTEDFIFRAFDYGIHKAYYLDWDLYLSHDMY